MCGPVGGVLGNKIGPKTAMFGVLGSKLLGGNSKGAAASARAGVPADAAEGTTPGGPTNRADWYRRMAGRGGAVFAQAEKTAG